MQDLLKKLTAVFNRKPSAEYVATWLDRMKKYERQDVVDAVEYLKDNEVDLPSINRCLITVDSIAANRRHRENEQLKMAEKREAQRFWSGALTTDEFGKQCLVLIKDAMSGAITRAEFITRGEALGMTMTYKQYCSDHGHDMNKKVGEGICSIG